MRVGQNPYKYTPSSISRPRISCGIVTHYLDNHPYHRERMPIVRMCIESIQAANPGEVIVWDNGSSPDFRIMLHNLKPDVLVESINVGLGMARHNLFELARAEIFCCSDDDVLHEPGWMAKQLQILTTYPNVGVVGGSPQRVHFRWGIKSNLELAEKYKMKIERGSLIPEWMEKEYAASVGIDNITSWYSRTAGEQDILLEYKGVKAWAHGHHMQFMCYRDKIKSFYLPDDKYMVADRITDDAIDNVGYMRLTTYERTVRHLGNRV